MTSTATKKSRCNSFTEREDVCESLKFERIPGARLGNVIVRLTSMSSNLKCISQCVITPQCFSVNYLYSVNGSVCELSGYSDILQDIKPDSQSALYYFA